MKEHSSPGLDPGTWLTAAAAVLAVFAVFFLSHLTGQRLWQAYALGACLAGMVAVCVVQRQRLRAELDRASQTLALTTANFHSLAQSPALMVWTTDAAGKIDWINDTWIAFTGASLKEMQGGHWDHFVPPEDWREIQPIYEAALARCEGYEIEFRLRNQNGVLRWMVANASPRFDDEGRFLGYCGACRDITQRKEAIEDAHRKERLLRSIFDTSGAGIFTLDADSRIVQANRCMEEMFIATGHALLGKHYSELTVSEDRQSVMANLDQLKQGRVQELKAQRRYLRTDGRNFWGHVSVRRLSDDAGNFLGLVGTIIDITAEHEAQAQLQVAAQVFESSNEGVLITDRENLILSVNRAFTEITGYSPGDVIGRSPGILASGHQSRAFYQEMWSRLMSENRWSGEIWNRRKDGKVYPQWLSISVVRNEDGAVSHYIGVIQDITERKNAEARIRYLAQYDYLTDLPNRSLLYDRLSQIHAAARRYGKRFAVLFVDLDDFKPVNDQYGHETGDNLLRQVAQRLKEQVRAADTVARHGGDEFVVLAPEIQHFDEVKTLAEKLVTVISSPYRIGDIDVHVTPSIGVAIYPDDGEETDTLMRKADAAMYRAKAAGRNGIAYGCSPMLQLAPKNDA